MQRVVRLAALVLLLACAVGGGEWSVSAAERPPVDAWNNLDDALFAVQAGLLADDDAAVNTAATDATNAANAFLGVIPSSTDPLPDLQSTLTQIASAAQAGDQVEVARLRGIAHGEALVISYHATM